MNGCFVLFCHLLNYKLILKQLSISLDCFENSFSHVDNSLHLFFHNFIFSNQLNARSSLAATNLDAACFFLLSSLYSSMHPSIISFCPYMNSLREFISSLCLSICTECLRCCSQMVLLNWIFAICSWLCWSLSTLVYFIFKVARSAACADFI